MMGLILALSLMAIGALVLKRRNIMRHRADQIMLESVDEMFHHWNTLMDAKMDVDKDVPDEIMELANFMIKCARWRGVEFELAKVLEKRAGQPAVRTPPVNGAMREPLREVFNNLVHAWFRYVSHRNLFARTRIRLALGRRLVRDDSFQPFDAKFVSQIARKKDNCPPPGAAAA